MNITMFNLLLLAALFACIQAGPEYAGHAIQHMWHGFKFLFETLPAGETMSMAKGIISSRGAGQLPFFDEFIFHIFDNKRLNGYDSKGLGRTTNPPLTWATTKLGPGSDAFLPGGMPPINPSKLFPGWYDQNKAKTELEGMKPVLQELARQIQEARGRPDKPNVDKTALLREYQKAGLMIQEARWKNLQDHKIQDFNNHFRDRGFTAVTRKYPLLDGRVVDVFDHASTVAQSTNPNDRLEFWSRVWGTKSMELSNKDQMKKAKSHFLLVQMYENVNRLAFPGGVCRYPWPQK